MLIYHSDKPYTVVSALKEVIIEVFEICIAWQLLEYFKIHVHLFDLLVYTPVVIVVKFIYDIRDLKANKVVLDTSKRLVVVTLYSATGSGDVFDLPFNECRVKIDRSRDFLTGKRNICISFYLKRSLQCKVLHHKTGFTRETLENLAADLERLTHEAGR